jgi:Co/Zn/Cd efflux system component
VVILLLNVALLGGSIIVGLTAHSTSVLAEGVDYLADAAGVGVALWAGWQSRKNAQTRAYHLAVVVNAGWLLALRVGN